MRGSIIKQKHQAEGSWSIILDTGRDPVTGKRRQQWLTFHGSKHEAERKLAELLHQLETGSFVKPTRTTLAEFLERWLKDYAHPNLGPRTSEGYEHIIERHIIPALGAIPINSLKPDRIQQYYSDKLSTGRCDGAAGLSAQTVRHQHTCLHKALQTAVEWGILARNPADAVKLPSAEHPAMQTWNEEEIIAFLEAAKDTPYYALWHLALFGGLRRSELLGLKWSDVDLLGCQVHVTRSLHVLKGGKVVIRQPKSKKSQRAVALSPFAVLVLREYRAEQESFRIHAGTLLKDDDFVFSDAHGKPLLPNSVTHAWIKLVRSTGMKYIRLHDARHTHASLMLKQGVHPKIVQERLGHSSIGITLDTYSHVAPGLQEAAAKRFDDAFASRYNETANEDSR